MRVSNWKEVHSSNGYFHIGDNSLARSYMIRRNVNRKYRPGIDVAVWVGMFVGLEAVVAEAVGVGVTVNVVMPVVKMAVGK